MRPLSASASSRVTVMVALVVLTLLVAGRAAAQCQITGPPALCDGSAELCAPAGDYMYEWTGPGTFFSTDRCITVTTPGTYVLSVFDMISGLEFGPCLHDLAPAPTVTASISGPSSVCNGSTASLCGPGGSFGYAWSGPGGFVSTEQCISVGAEGTYSLIVTDLASGCSSVAAEHTLAVASSPVATITGADRTCAGSPVELCGPSGSLGYAWSGPAGFDSTAQCVSVGTAGSYSLVVTDLASGCSSAAAQHTLAVTSAPVASITGSDRVCAGSTVELCGPGGSFGYAWSGPGGFASASQCVSVGTEGTYSLVVTDPASGCRSAQVDHNLTAASLPLASITGPSEVCAGSSIQLCGPTGNLTYEWSGPAGFTGTTACASVGVDGVYRLVVRDVASGCASAAAEHVVGVGQCQTLTNCPRPASFWARQCRAGDLTVGAIDPTENLGDQDLASIAAMVDDHTAFFHWSDERDGFCATVRAIPRTLAARAARQFAATWANVSAGSLGLVQSSSRPIALDPGTHIDLPEASMTVGQWLAATDAALASLAQRPPRDRAVKAAYRQIITVGWHVNHGFGIGPVCGRGGSGDPDVAHPGGRMTPLSTGFGGTLVDEEPLAVELADEDRASLSFTPIQPNPFAINARLGFTIVSTNDENVTIGVYDLSGRLVHELTHGSFAPGAYEVRWDGRDDRGGLARNGMYFVLGRVNGGQVKSRVSLLR